MRKTTEVSAGIAALMVFALLAACSHTTKGGSGTLGVSAPNVSAPAISGSAAPSGGPTLEATTAPSTTTPRPTPTKTRTKNQPPPPPPDLAVTDAVTTPDDVVTIDCPHHFTVNGTVTVSAGPVDVTYLWLRDGVRKSAASTLHFKGTGSQTLPVTDDDADIAYNGTDTDTLVLLTPVRSDTATTTFHLSCTASASTPTVFKSSGGCPASFLSKISAAVGAQSVTVQWHFSDGNNPQALTYMLGPDQTSRVISINHPIPVSPDIVYLQVTNGAGMTTDKLTATCS